jgi:hypothetical protein
MQLRIVLVDPNEPRRRDGSGSAFHRPPDDAGRVEPGTDVQNEQAVIGRCDDPVSQFGELSPPWRLDEPVAAAHVEKDGAAASRTGRHQPRVTKRLRVGIDLRQKTFDDRRARPDLIRARSQTLQKREVSLNGADACRVESAPYGRRSPGVYDRTPRGGQWRLRRNLGREKSSRLVSGPPAGPSIGWTRATC